MSVTVTALLAVAGTAVALGALDAVGRIGNGDGCGGAGHKLRDSRHNRRASTTRLASANDNPPPLQDDACGMSTKELVNDRPAVTRGPCCDCGCCGVGNSRGSLPLVYCACHCCARNDADNGGSVGPPGNLGSGCGSRGGITTSVTTGVVRHRDGELAAPSARTSVAVPEGRGDGGALLRGRSSGCNSFRALLAATAAAAASATAALRDVARALASASTRRPESPLRSGAAVLLAPSSCPASCSRLASEHPDDATRSSDVTVWPSGVAGACCGDGAATACDGAVGGSSLASFASTAAVRPSPPSPSRGRLACVLLNSHTTPTPTPTPTPT